MTIINTFSGIEFDLLNPNPNDIDIEDIAHELSMLCRFNGHCKEFYSVAEHSVYVSYEIDEEFALIGLLHDAAEAYLGDVPTPLKKLLPEFKRADNQLFADEFIALIEGKPPENTLAAKMREFKFLEPNDAQQLFLDRFKELST